MTRLFGLALSALILVSLALPLTTTATRAADDTTANPDRPTVEKWVRDYLVNNPEVIVEALEVLQNRQQAMEQRQQRDLIAAMNLQFADDPLTYVAGNPDGDVTIYEFFDYKCGYCKKALATVLELLEDDKNLRFVMMELPILSEESGLAAKAALAAIDQGKYFEFHNNLMMARGTLSEGRIFEMATAAGMDAAKLAKRMQDKDIEAALTRNQQLTVGLGIRGTPGFIVGDTILRGALPIDDFRSAIKDARGKS